MTKIRCHPNVITSMELRIPDSHRGGAVRGDQSRDEPDYVLHFPCRGGTNDDVQYHAGRVILRHRARQFSIHIACLAGISCHPARVVHKRNDIGVLETLAGANWAPGITLNAYLRITATGKDVITSVGFENLTSADFLGFSHLALQYRTAAPTVTPVIVGRLG